MLHRDLITPKPFIFWGYFFSCVLRDSHFDVVTQLTLERSSCVTPPPRDPQTRQNGTISQALRGRPVDFWGKGTGVILKNIPHAFLYQKQIHAHNQWAKKGVRYTEHEEYQASLRTNSLVHERVKQNSCLYQVTHTSHQKSKGPPLVQAGYWILDTEKPMLRAAGPRLWNLKWDPRPYMWYQFLKGSTNIPASINGVPPSTSPTPRSP